MCDMKCVWWHLVTKRLTTNPGFLWVWLCLKVWPLSRLTSLYHSHRLGALQFSAGSGVRELFCTFTAKRFFSSAGIASAFQLCQLKVLLRTESISRTFHHPKLYHDKSAFIYICTYLYLHICMFNNINININNNHMYIYIYIYMCVCLSLSLSPLYLFI